MPPVQMRRSIRLMLASLVLLAGSLATINCKNPDEFDPNLGFRLFDTPNIRVVVTDPRFRPAGTDPFSQVTLERLRLTYYTLNDVLQAINGTASTLDIAGYDLSSQTMVNTLVQLANRGVTVRVVTESGQFSSVAPPPSGPVGVVNRGELLSSLQQAGVQVRVDNDDLNRAMNARYAIVDNRLVITGSADLLSQDFYDIASGNPEGSVNMVLMINSSRSLPPGGSVGEIVTALDAFAFDFEEMFIRQRFGNAKTIQSRTNFNVGVPVDLFFGPKGDLRNALAETMFDARARARYSVGRYTDSELQTRFFFPMANRLPGGLNGVVDGWQTQNFAPLAQNAGAVPYFYPTTNLMNHSWFAADFPMFREEFRITPPALSNPVLFVTTNPWTANSFDGDDAVGIRVYDVAAAVRMGMVEYEVMRQATGVNPQTGQASGLTVRIFGEVRSAANNAPITASVRIRSRAVGYLPGDGDQPVEVDTNPDTGEFVATIQAGLIEIDVVAVDGPYRFPPQIRTLGARFPGGSAEVNYYLSLVTGGTSGS